MSIDHQEIWEVQLRHGRYTRAVASYAYLLDKTSVDLVRLSSAQQILKIGESGKRMKDVK